MMKHYESDSDLHKGAVEQDKPEQPDNTSLSGQLPHRPDTDLIDGNDTDFPEPGENPEHSGEPQEQRMTSQQDAAKKTEQKTPELNPEGRIRTRIPGNARNRITETRKTTISPRKTS